MGEVVFEVSSEAARQVGGIYTVLQSKAPYLVKKYGPNYVLLGFLDERCLNDFREQKAGEEIEKIIKKMREKGIEAKYGEWINGSGARTFLLNAKGFAERIITYEDNGTKTDTNLNYIKFLLWKNFQMDSLMEKSWDFGENLVWGWSVGMLLEELLKTREFEKGKAVAQFHEWISGSALLYCRLKKLPIKTVFTTHATVLGRTLSSFGRDVLSEAASESGQVNISQAYQFKVEGKHQLEMCSAGAADIFTTVSDTVAQEVKYILGRKPDIITLNGMNFEGEKEEKEVASLSKYVRLEVLQFIESLFTPYYEQSYLRPLLIYISGRYEYKNKGFDIYIEALGKLNSTLKEKNPKRRIFAFIFAPSAISGPRIATIKNYLLLDKIHEVLEETAGKEFRADNYENIHTCIEKLRLGEVLKNNLKNMASGFVRDASRPLINCFDLNYANDEIVRSCYAAGLTNSKEDVVKVIFYPTYLKANDGLLNLPYYDVISGMDVGIFPSRYEPFGYTPVEAGLKLNIAITSDTTGFGRFISGKVKEESGVKVLKMFGVEKGKTTDELAHVLEKIYNLDAKELQKMQSDAYNTVKLCDWKELIPNYYKAYEMALKTK